MRCLRPQPSHNNLHANISVVLKHDGTISVADGEEDQEELETEEEEVVPVLMRWCSYFELEIAFRLR